MLTWAQDVSGLAANELRFVVEPTGIYHEFLVQLLYQRQATIYLVNPSRVRKFAAGMGILSKNDLIDATCSPLRIAESETAALPA